MNTEKLETHYENRIYYYYLKLQEAEKIVIEMYSTPYIFVKSSDKWVNHTLNKLDMNEKLISAIVSTLLMKV